MIIDSINELISKNGITSYAECERICGLANGTIGKWKRNENKPSLDYLIKLADYFGVSIDYLVGRTDNPAVNK